MTMRRTTDPLLALLLMTAGVTACDSPRGAAPAPSSSAPTGASRSMVIISYSAPRLVGGQLNIHQSMEKHAKEKGWQIITTTSDGDPEKQVEQIKNFIKLRVNAVVAVPDDSRGICAAVEAAKAAQIPFYTIDRAPQGCRVNMVVLSDNYLAGKQSAEALIDLLRQKHGEPKGAVLEITGNMAQNVAQLRGKGFEDVIQKHPRVKLITKVADWTGEKAEVIVREVLSSTPDLDGIYLHSDATYIQGVQKVLRELGRLKRRGEPGHVFLVAVDGSPIGGQALKDGYADQTSNQPVTDFGIIAEWIEQEFQGKPITEGEVKRDGVLWSPARVTIKDIGPEIILPTTSVTETNMNDPRLWANQP
jgi:ABC-type sugar transport system substrate-binding protein